MLDHFWVPETVEQRREDKVVPWRDAWDYNVFITSVNDLLLLVFKLFYAFS